MFADEGHTTFAAIVDRWAAERAIHPVLGDEGGALLTWRELHRLVRESRAALRALGVGRTDRVAALMPPGPRSAALLIVLGCSVTSVPLEDGKPEPELLELLPRLGLAAAVCLDGPQPSQLAAAAEKMGVPVIWLRPEPDPFRFRLDGAQIGPPSLAGAPGPDDPGVIITTSGTTGRPKLVVHAQSRFWGRSGAFDPSFPVEPGWKTIVLSSMGLGMGMTTLRRSLACGGMTVAPSTLDASRISSLADAFDPDWLYMPPSSVSTLAAAAAGGWSPSPSLRYIRSSSARLDSAVREALRTPIFDSYASTETGMVAREGFGLPHRPGFVGRIEAQLRIVEDGRIMPEGTRGEIQVRGPRVFAGYFDDPDATARAFTADGWYRTGDLGSVEDGYLALLGRIDDLINCGGRKIDPEVIERAMRQWTGIVDAAAYGAPHARLGQQPAAAVVLAPGCTFDRRALRRWLIERLGPNAAPKRIDVLESLPRTANGKLSRLRLAAAAASAGEPCADLGPDAV